MDTSIFGVEPGKQIGRMDFQHALEERLGTDYRTASRTLEAVLDLIVCGVEQGSSVTLTRFGTFTPGGKRGVKFTPSTAAARRLEKSLE